MYPLSNLYQEGIFTGILEVIQILYTQDKHKEEYINILTQLAKPSEDIDYYTNYFFK